MEEFREEEKCSCDGKECDCKELQEQVECDEECK